MLKRVGSMGVPILVAIVFFVWTNAAMVEAQVPPTPNPSPAATIVVTPAPPTNTPLPRIATAVGSTPTITPHTATPAPTIVGSTPAPTFTPGAGALAPTSTPVPATATPVPGGGQVPTETPTTVPGGGAPVVPSGPAPAGGAFGQVKVVKYRGSDCVTNLVPEAGVRFRLGTLEFLTGADGSDQRTVATGNNTVEMPGRGGFSTCARVLDPNGNEIARQGFGDGQTVTAILPVYDGKVTSLLVTNIAVVPSPTPTTPVVITSAPPAPTPTVVPARAGFFGQYDEGTLSLGSLFLVTLLGFGFYKLVARIR